MFTLKKAVLAATVVATSVMVSSVASACVLTARGWVQPSPYGWQRCSPNIYYAQRDPYRMVGPYAGAGSAAALRAYGVPAPVASWAGERIRENYNAAHREANPVTAVIRGHVGVSVRDIQKHGILGGNNSEARKACNAIAGIFGGGC